MNKLGICVVLIIVANYINAQKLFTFSAEAGAIQPIPIFYKGEVAATFDDRKISTNIGFSVGIHGKWHYDRKSFLSLGVYYDSYSLNIKEFVRFPVDITPDGIPHTNKSYFYSNFDVRNLGLRVSFGNVLSKKINLNTGFQVGFPLKQHFGYIYVGPIDFIEKSYDYETKNPFTLFANVTYQWYQTKRIGFTLVPEIGYNLQKDEKTYIHENQIRKMTFALRVGVGLK
jgi:hypothetical protein